MADFEDNNPFAASDTRSDISSSNADVLSPTGYTEPGFEHIINYGAGGGNNHGDTGDDENDENNNNTNNTNRHPIRTYTSRIDQILSESPNLVISIIEAGKSHEGNSRGFIVYTIKIQDIVIRRRYSEFESLRTILTKLFPTLIVPPIPEKQSVSDYAAAPTKAKEDAQVIEHRQRMLAVFLNRCCQMPEIRQSSVFHRFLDPNSSWSEVLNSPPVSNVPKSILRAPPLDPSAPTAAHAYLPIPSSSAKLQSGENRAFDETEARAKEYEAVISGGLDKVNRRTIKRYSELAGLYSELGARFNAFSLEEQGALANGIEKVGQAADSCYISTEAMVSSLSSSFTEPLGESAQFAAVVRSVLKYRRQKAIQKELTIDMLESKKATLRSLEQSEKEAQRINSYLHGETPSNAPEDSNAENSSSSSSPSSPHSHPPPPPANAENLPLKKRAFKIPGIAKLNNAIHGFIDVDPEATRRTNIGKTREHINQLQDALIVADADIKSANESVKNDLDRFQATKENDLHDIMVAYLECHVEWAKKNLEAWQEVQSELDKV